VASATLERARGGTVCRRYKELRKRILVAGETGISPEAMSSLARSIRLLSGHHDQATRKAASL